MKSLKIIQTLAKIGKVLSKIGFIFCIIGFCGCIVGVIGLAVGVIGLAVGVEGLKVGGVTLRNIIETNAEMNMPTLYAAMAVGILFCAAEAVLCKFAETYFKNELADGTPFTLRGSKELMRLGILNVAVPLGTVIICAIVAAVIGIFYPETVKPSFDGYGSFGIGIFLMILSLVCRYGAELNEGKAEKDNI